MRVEGLKARQRESGVFCSGKKSTAGNCKPDLLLTLGTEVWRKQAQGMKYTCTSEQTSYARCNRVEEAICFDFVLFSAKTC